jgi:predicted metal-dependent phosphoesterase TrpH
MRLRPFVPLISTAALVGIGVLVSSLVPRTGSTAIPPPPTLAPEGGLSFDVRDAESGNPIPCKLTLIGVDGTQPPKLTKNDIGRQEEGAIAAHDRIMAATGVGVARVPFGTYDVYVSRGPEWDLFIARRVVVNAKGARIVAKLRHVVNSDGWVSADFHVHASASSDSRVPMQDRVYEFLSDGVEVITSTDHNVVSDYSPIIKELGVTQSISSLTGDEMTTGGWGHFGAFPLPHDMEKAGQGAMLVHARTAQQMFADVREHAPLAIIDIHHPRIDNEIGYFNLAQLDAQHDRAAKPGFSFDFDAVEVLNGYQDPERRSVDRVINEWFLLLEHGHFVTATGNSDTHHLDHNIGGYPRNYVQVRDDRPSSVTPESIARAVKHHKSFFTSAPFVRIRAGGVDLGEVADARSGNVKVEIEVQAAPWVSVSSAVLYQSGKEVKRWSIPASTETVRFKDSFSLPVTADGWLVLRVDGDKPLAPVVGDRKRFDVRPLALTNPIFLDHDGNGQFDAPLKGK